MNTLQQMRKVRTAITTDTPAIGTFLEAAQDAKMVIYNHTPGKRQRLRFDYADGTSLELTLSKNLTNSLDNKELKWGQLADCTIHNRKAVDAATGAETGETYLLVQRPQGSGQVVVTNFNEIKESYPTRTFSNEIAATMANEAFGG